MVKVKLQNGGTGTLLYRGENEDERIDSALNYNTILEIGGRMNNRGDLTPGIERVLGVCIDYFVEIIPDQEPQQQQQVAPTDPINQPQEGQPDLTSRRRRTV